jgi:hypothetical protein
MGMSIHPIAKAATNDGLISFKSDPFGIKLKYG